MWELSFLNDNNLRSPKIYKNVKSDDIFCPICGQKIKNFESHYIILAQQSKDAYMCGVKNFFAHTQCWNRFCSGVTTEAELIWKYKHHIAQPIYRLSNEEVRYKKVFDIAINAFDFPDSVVVGEELKSNNGVLTVVCNYKNRCISCIPTDDSLVGIINENMKKVLCC